MAIVTIRLRRDSAAAWTTKNPVLRSGEPGFELDTGQLKIGNGVASWNSLPYFLDAADMTLLFQNLIDAEDAPVDLIDAPTIQTNYASGRHFRVTLSGDRILGRPTNLIDGRKVIWEFTQDEVGGRVLTLDSVFNLGSDIQSVVLSTGEGKRDLIGTVYHEDTDSLDVIAFIRGF